METYFTKNQRSLVPKSDIIDYVAELYIKTKHTQTRIKVHNTIGELHTTMDMRNQIEDLIKTLESELQLLKTQIITFNTMNHE